MQGLIVNADDFGFSPEINEGVCEAHLKGIVTDASLLVRSPYASQAIQMATRINLPLGLHIDFVTPYSNSARQELGPNGHLTQELFNRERNDQITSLFSTEELLILQDEIRDQIEEFKAAIGNLIVTAYPQKGEIHLDHRKVASCPCRRPHRLIWFWRMGLELSGNGLRPEPNTAAPSFECYGLGLECAENKFGMRFFRDGTVKSGLE